MTTTPKVPQKEFWNISDGILFTIDPENSENFATRLFETQVVIYFETSGRGTWVGKILLPNESDKLLSTIDIDSVTHACIVHHPEATNWALEIVTAIQKRIPHAKIVQAKAIRAYPSLVVIEPIELVGEWQNSLLFPRSTRGYFEMNHFLAFAFGINATDNKVRNVTRDTTLFQLYEDFIF